MNDNFNQPYKPSGEINFGVFDPPQSKNNRRNNPRPQNKNPNGKLRAEYERLGKRMKEIESLLNLKSQNKPNPGKPVRYGNEYRSYAYKNKRKQEKKAPVLDKVINNDASQEILDTKKELGF